MLDAKIASWLMEEDRTKPIIKHRNNILQRPIDLDRDLAAAVPPL